MSTEVQSEYLRERPKSTIEKIFDFLFSKKVGFLLVAPFICLFAFPVATLPLLFVIGVLFWLQHTNIPAMPFMRPQSSGLKYDPFNPKPGLNSDGEKTFKAAKGIAYMGNVKGTNEQAWFDDSTLRQHIGFLAATGSGKTYSLTGMSCVNALIWGSGYIYIDAKADLALVVSHLSILWRLNRVDDFFNLNFIQGSMNPWDDFSGHLTTNSYNMLESGSASQAIETFKSLLDGDGDIWAKRGASLSAGILRPAVYCRDAGLINLSMATMLDYLTVESAGGLCGDERIPDKVKSQLYGFLKTLPGMTEPFFREVLQGKTVKSTQVYDQWGFAAMQIILVINMLSGDYAKIFDVTIGEINLESIVLQDRVMLSLLPALEASGDSIASMGRIILAARKGMMGRSLGERIEGSVKANIEQRPTNTVYPFVTVSDEVGMIFANGEGAASAQARGLGYCLVYSAQDLPAMKKLNDEVAKEVDTVMGNTIIKIAGRIIDDSTYELYSKIAGEMYVWQKDRSNLSFGDSLNQRTSEDSASYTKVERLEKRKLQELREGELYICAIDKLHRIDAPDLHVKNLKVMQLNTFITMVPYTPTQIYEAKSNIDFLESEYIAIINGQKTFKEIDVVDSNLDAFEQMVHESFQITSDIERSMFLSLSCTARVCLEELEELSNSQIMNHEAQEKENEKLAAEVGISQSSDEEVASTSDETTSDILNERNNKTAKSVQPPQNDEVTENSSTENFSISEDGDDSETDLQKIISQSFAEVGISTDEVVNNLTEIDTLSGIPEQEAFKSAQETSSSFVITNDYPSGTSPMKDAERVKQLLAAAIEEIKR